MHLTCHRGQTHEYIEEESGARLFSVTQIRKVAYDHYAGIPMERLKEARIRGALLHRRFFFVIAARGGLCAHPPPITRYAGFCTSMDDWVEKHLVKPVKLEHKSLNRRYGYAGQADGQVLYGPTALLTLMDLKTGEETITDPLQLVAYNNMEDLKSRALLDLYLDKDGGPARERWIKPGEQGVEWSAFLNALSLLRWRTSKGKS
jgi:hypothetical protein